MTKQLTRRIFLAAILAMMTIVQYSPLSLIRFSGLEITFMHILVLIGIYVFADIKESVILGTWFGLLSMMYSVMFPSITTTPFINPLISVLPRVVFALIAYYIFSKIKDSKNVPLQMAWAFSSTAIHTILVLTMFWIFYSNVLKLEILYAIITTNGLAEMILAALVVVPVGKAVKTFIASRE